MKEEIEFVEFQLIEITTKTKNEILKQFQKEDYINVRIFSDGTNEFLEMQKLNEGFIIYYKGEKQFAFSEPTQVLNVEKYNRCVLVSLHEGLDFLMSLVDKKKSIVSLNSTIDLSIPGCVQVISEEETKILYVENGNVYKGKRFRNVDILNCIVEVSEDESLQLIDCKEDKTFKTSDVVHWGNYKTSNLILAHDNYGRKLIIHPTLDNFDENDLSEIWTDEDSIPGWIRLGYHDSEIEWNAVIHMKGNYTITCDYEELVFKKTIIPNYLMHKSENSWFLIYADVENGNVLKIPLSVTLEVDSEKNRFIIICNKSGARATIQNGILSTFQFPVEVQEKIS
ncbi:MAG: hypothetical protein ACI9AR_000165 [Flavobacteriaceae bacterium]|jgi:hypothetical protein